MNARSAAAGGPDISIVIPAYNEARRLPATLEAVTAWLDGSALGARAELVVVDDGSADATAQVITQAATAHSRVRAVVRPDNRGKGAAVREGVRQAAGRVVVFFDADLPYPLDTIDEAWRRLEAGAQVVLGARDLSGAQGLQQYSPLRKAATRAFNLLVEQALDLGIPDTQCGFKAFTAEVARPLFEALTIERFGFDVELLFLARRWDLRLERVPVRMAHGGDSSVRVVRDSLQMARDVLHIRARARRGAYPTREVALQTP